MCSSALANATSHLKSSLLEWEESEKYTKFIQNSYKILTLNHTFTAFRLFLKFRQILENRDFSFPCLFSIFLITDYFRGIFASATM